jgi:serine/threonine protein kinase
VTLRTLREVRLLRLLHHDKIIDMKCVLQPEESDHYQDLYLVFELMEADLYKIIRSSQNLTDVHFQYFIAQILSALVHMHSLSKYLKNDIARFL